MQTDISSLLSKYCYAYNIENESCDWMMNEIIDAFVDTPLVHFNGMILTRHSLSSYIC